MEVIVHGGEDIRAVNLCATTYL